MQTGLVNKKKKIEIKETLLKLNDVQEIKIKDKTMSIVVSIAIPALVIGIAAYSYEGSGW